MAKLQLPNYPPDHGLRVPAAAMSELVTNMFIKVGMSQADAAFTASLLVQCDLRCVFSHGTRHAPDYLRKIPALFYEFEQIGTNEALGYKNPDDMRKGYATFFWDKVHPYIQDAARFLRATQDGKQWLANLHSHVFQVEHNQE